jgi:hypothetical protein
MEILDAKGTQVGRYSSDAAAAAGGWRLAAVAAGPVAAGAGAGAAAAGAPDDPDAPMLEGRTGGRGGGGVTVACHEEPGH